MEDFIEFVSLLLHTEWLRTISNKFRSTIFRELILIHKGAEFEYRQIDSTVNSFLIIVRPQTVETRFT